MTPEEIHNNTIDLVTRALRAGARFTNVNARTRVRIDGGTGAVDGGQVIELTLRMPPDIDLWALTARAAPEHADLKDADVEVADGDAPRRIE